MSKYVEAKGSISSFDVNRKNDGGFRVYGMTSAPYLSITHEQAEMWLSWMENNGIEKGLCAGI